MFKDLFYKRRRYATIPSEKAKKDIPEGVMSKCRQCSAITYTKELLKQQKVCAGCGYHFPLTAYERLQMTLDDGHFFEFDKEMTSKNPLSFPDYEERLARSMDKTGMKEAVVTGEGTIYGYPVIIGVMDFKFMGGSMGSVVGEKIMRAIERSIQKRYPFLLFSASGGARMQEGVRSLMQMGKTSTALSRLDQAGILFISVFTNPTTGGVSASFASLGDYNLAEPRALIGFAGRRIIEQTIRQELPQDFQTAEFLLKHGQLDQVVDRPHMRETLGTLLELHAERSES